MMQFLTLGTSSVGSLADPVGASPLTAAVLWLQDTLLGTIATTIAVIAVASVGLLMLAGRVELRRGATVVIGCFLLFGATSIAAGIRASASGFGEQAYEPAQTPPPPAVVIPQPGPAYDPYAGASVPRRR